MKLTEDNRTHDIVVRVHERDEIVQALGSGYYRTIGLVVVLGIGYVLWQILR